MVGRIVLAAVSLALLAAPAAHASVLYTTLDQPNNVQGINSDFATNTAWVAQSFTLAQAGTPASIAFYAQANIGDTAPVTMSIYSNLDTASGAIPANELVKTNAETVPDQTGDAPTCASIAAPQSLAAGKYWAVFKSDSGGASWFYQRNDTRTSLRTSASGASWTTNAAAKVFSLRIEDTACAPDVDPNPTAGSSAGDFAQRPGTVDDATVTLQNKGTRALTITGASFSDPGASVFKVRQGEPGGVMDIPFVFPKTIGATAEAVLIMHVDCAPAGDTPDGLYQATFNVTTNDPDEPTVSWPVACIVDGTPPFIVLTTGFPGGRDDWFLVMPSIHIDGADTGVGLWQIFCNDTAGPTLTELGHPVDFTLTNDGDHMLDCRSNDFLGNTIPAGTHLVHYKVDTTAPNATKSGGPEQFQYIPTNTPTFEWTAVEATSGVQEIECRVDAGPFIGCASPKKVAALSEGPHVFAVRLTDVAGNVDATPASWTFHVDTIPPTTEILEAPPAVTTETTAHVGAEGVDLPDVIKWLECSLDDGAWHVCESPATYELLAEGKHTARVRAVDHAGNGDPTPAEVTWSIDLTAPTATFVSKPPVLTAARSATFEFTGANAGPAPTASFSCRLDDAADFTPCPSPVTFDDLADESEHTLAVIATDTLGNVQATPTTYTWTISHRPRAIADTFAATADTPADLDVVANDLNPLTGGLTPVLAGAASAKGGAISVVGAQVHYVPPAGFTGSDSFTYRASNSADLLSVPVTVTVVVTPKQVVPPPPPPPVQDRTAPVVSNVKVKKRALRFALTEPATVKVVVKERVKGKRKPVTRGRFTVTGQAGSNVARKARKLLKPGRRYVITVVAVDAAGNTSAPVKVKPARIPRA